jgi:glycerol-3-phosphate acyltransferase PlsY
LLFDCHEEEFASAEMGEQIPNPKSQNPNKSPIPNLKQSRVREWAIGICEPGIYLGFGIWNLEFPPLAAVCPLKFAHPIVILRAVEAAAYIVTALAAYLLGSLPTGYLVARSRGVDIRTVGSGNIGATNVLRVLGKPAGILVLFVDALKGFIAARYIGWFAYQILAGGVEESSTTDEALKIIGGIVAILGHNFTCWLKFKGGKGIATSAGVALALLPVAMGIAVVVFCVVCFATRYVSIASISAAAVLPVAAWWPARSSRTMIGVAAVIAALAIYKHRTNIQRLMNGTENRFGKKPEAGS